MSDPASNGASTVFRTDLSVSGNRIIEGPADLTVEPIAVAIPGRPVWVLPWPDGDDGTSWLVTLADGPPVLVDQQGTVEPAPDVAAEALDGAPPEVVMAPDGGPAVRSAYVEQQRFDEPLPDARVVSDGVVSAALVRPTDRYPHDVLGDALEAAAVEVIDLASGARTVIEVDEPAVLEGIAPLLGDIDGDGVNDVLFTVSDADVGARLVAYRTDGSLLGRSEPIGQGRRWRNQMAVAPIGPNGEIEIVDVRTPHIGGTVEFFRLVDERLEIVATSEPAFTSHVIGTRNLDMGIVVDGDGDGDLDVVLPTSRRTGVAVITRTGDGVSATVTELGDEIVSNIAARAGPDATAVAMASADTLFIWPG